MLVLGASGGVGTLDHLVEGVTEGHADAVLAASIFHFGEHTVAEAKAVMQAAGSVLTNKYAEGYPGRRYYGGCECVDVVENLARSRAKELFGAEYVNVQPHSGSQANAAAYMTAVESGDTSDRSFGLALDIGTTTIYGQLIDLKSGESLAEDGDFNGQISYGEDVISRMIFAEKGDGLEKLQQTVIGTINKVLGKIVSRAGVAREDISTITMAGMGGIFGFGSSAEGSGSKIFIDMARRPPGIRCT